MLAVVRDARRWLAVPRLHVVGRGRRCLGDRSAVAGGARWCSAALGGRSAVLGGARRCLCATLRSFCSVVLGGAQRCSAVLSGAFVVVGGGRHAGRGACVPLSAVEVGGGLCVVLGGRRRRSGRRWGLPGSGGGLAVKLTSNTQPYTPLTPTHGSALTRLNHAMGRAGGHFVFDFCWYLVYFLSIPRYQLRYSTGYNGNLVFTHGALYFIC